MNTFDLVKILLSGAAIAVLVFSESGTTEPTPKSVELIYNGQARSIETEEVTVGQLVIKELGGLTEYTITPDPNARLQSGDRIIVVDEQAVVLAEAITENIETLSAAPKTAEPKQEPVVATKPAPKPEPVVVPPVVAAEPVTPVVLPEPEPQPSPAPEPIPPVVTPTLEIEYLGYATWYRHGDGFTTASRDFPIGTKLLVTAMNSGKTVEVIVNDYGPQISTGISLDLNAVAFAQLAPLGAGKIYIKYSKI